jgi:hypothetical protein
MLCTAIKDSLGEIIGVVQIINKADGPFTAADEEICGIFTAQASESALHVLWAA